MRSKLFVPGSRKELFTKAVNSHADAISLDLEDSVSDGLKDHARQNVATFLQSLDVQACKKNIVVRCNAVETPYFLADLDAIVHPAISMINLPKVETCAEVRAAINSIEQAENDKGLTTGIRILITIESARGLLSAAELASAHPRIAGLQLGLNDLFGSLGVDRQDTDNIHAVMFAVRMAAGAADVCVYDGAFTDIENESGFRAEARMAFQMGYHGKSCIHPRQVPLANSIFTPSEKDIELAVRILEKSRSAEAEDLGAFTLDGKMIDLPIIRRAEALVAASLRIKEVAKTDILFDDIAESPQTKATN